MPTDNPTHAELVEMEAARIAASCGVIFDELEDHGSDGENKAAYRRRARAALGGKP